jgi:hypothetical protein
VTAPSSTPPAAELDEARRLAIFFRAVREHAGEAGTVGGDDPQEAIVEAGRASWQRATREMADCLDGYEEGDPVIVLTAEGKAALLRAGVALDAGRNGGA